MLVVSLVTALLLLLATFSADSTGADIALATSAAAILLVGAYYHRALTALHLIVLAAVTVVPVTQWFEVLIVERDRSQQQQTVREQIGQLSSQVETALIANRGYLDALSLLVSTEPNVSQERYQQWLEQLIPAQTFSLLNITITNQFVITHVSPLEPQNLAILGTNLALVPDQVDDIRDVMETQNAKIVGPLNVLQGDTALVYRLPVSGQPHMIVSGVVSLDQVIDQATSGMDNLKLGLTVSRNGATTQLFSQGIPGTHRVSTRFDHGDLEWTILAEPRVGWKAPTRTLWMTRASALVVWLFIVLLLGSQYRVMRQREKERMQLKIQESKLLEAQRLGRLGSWTSLPDDQFALSAPLMDLLGTDQPKLSREAVVNYIYEPDRPYFTMHTQSVLDASQPFARFEHRIITPSALLWVEQTIALNDNHELTGMLRDITDIKTTEAELQKLNYYDSLTGASNRNFFGKQVQQGISLSQRNQNHLALVLFDLDNFKTINTNYGHTVGDEVLKQLTERIKYCIRNSDTVARLSGDTFAICLQNLKDPGHCIFVADTLLKSITEIIEIDEVRISITATLGIATSPTDDGDYEGLVKKAEIALRKAKEIDRGSYQFYSDQMNLENDRRQDILRLLPYALQNNEFHLVLQPRVDRVDQHWCSLEVLLRWNSHELGSVSPGEFIPIAEGSHLIVEIGNWVIRRALEEFSQHLAQLDDRVVLSINLSPKQLEERNLSLFIASEIHQAGVPAHRVEFEITEHSLTEESETTLTAMAELSAMGIRFAMDDFGTGYSNLGMLQALPLHVLKIDQRFIQRLEDGARHLALVEAIIDLGHTLDLTVVAEGVETEGQIKLLSELGCDELQGYYYYRPQPFVELLKERIET
ncbi:bifunctional diguanylate cyclase/phosphodiesterase [Saccharospirillum impatiens]|uniref:bifunctional diguanylate cyclase/phosphodiesterase n=1 Tax=Saccharospirillum impatiens TaxID=169438 RepID=UPI0004229E60|nr:EAL domain-containing protein [Saccharospirillum impatiens]